MRAVLSQVEKGLSGFRWVQFLVALVVLLIAVLVWVSVTGFSERQDSDPASLNATLRPRAQGQLTRPGEAFADGKVAPARIAPVVSTAAQKRVMHDPNAYASFIQLRAMQQPGSFALASELRAACHAASLQTVSSAEGFPFDGRFEKSSVDWQPLALAGVSALVQAKRVQAAQALRARCGDAFWAMEAERNALPSDVYGQAWQTANPRLLERLDLSRLQTLAEQGVLFQALQAMGSVSGRPEAYFEGRLLGGASSPDVFNRALGLAIAAATFDPEAATPHIYSLAVCIRLGACEGRLDEIMLADLPLDSPVRSEVMSLYPRLLAAAQRGDVRAFASPSGP